MITVRKGLDIPIEGAPAQTIEVAKPVATVGVLGRDYHGLKPTMLVQVGDQVQLGQPLFEDKKNPGVVVTAPASGEVTAINRGAKRAFLSLEIKVSDAAAKSFATHSPDQIESLDRESIRKFLQETGLWASLRQRPFDKVPAVDAEATAVFVNAMDTNPLAPDVAVIIEANQEAFVNGLKAVRKLTEGNTYVCSAPDAKMPSVDGVRNETFAGPHPAGLVGTHIHFLDSAGPTKPVWHLTAQDVIAIGYTLANGELYNKRVVALAGPEVKNPRLLETVAGADIEALCEDELNNVEERLISGSVLAGDAAHRPLNYLGRYHQQIVVLHEGREKEFFGWIMPGSEKYSVTKAYSGHLARLFGVAKKFRLTTTTNGSPRAMVPIGNYEKIMPLDVLPTQLLRSLIIGDTETAQALGCLELVEEDLALCTFVCPGKYEYGPILRDNLTTIEKEG